jgi:hypothetical protein
VGRLGRASLPALLAAIAGAASALEGPLVELGCAPIVAEPGKPVTLTVTYRWPAGWIARDPDPALAWADLPVSAYPPPTRIRTAEEERLTWAVLAIAPPTPGAWVLPRPSFAAVGPDGERQASAPQVVAQVGPDPAPPAVSAPSPVVAALPGEPPARRWWTAATGWLAVAALSGGAWWWLRRPARPPATPGERFRAECAAIATDGDAKEGAALLGLALRRYVGSVHGFDGLGATADEAAERARSGLPAHQHAALGELLAGLDHRRWAAADLPPTALAEALAEAGAWVAAAEAGRESERIAAQRANA